MIVKKYRDAEPEEMLEGVIKREVVNKPNDGAPTFCMRVFDVDPGCGTPYHTHDWEHEVYVLEGEGVAVNANGDETPVSRDSVVFVPGGELHGFKNTGDKNFRFICVIPY
jgi:quercetin dioxygenase-like cupin family protein